MKKIYISVALLMATISQAQVGFGTPTPDKSAQVEVSATDKGFLLPRVALVTLTNNTTPIQNPAEGLLVYNTTVLKAENLEQGFYVWDGTSWKRFATQDEISELGQDLTTDGKIVIGDNTSSVQTLADAVLVSTQLSIKTGSIGSNEITDGSITGGDIASETITGANISNKTITSNKLDAGNAAAGTVGVVQADGTIVYQNLPASSVNGKALISTDLDVSANGATALLKDVTVNIKTGAVTSEKIADGAIATIDLANNAVTTDKIAAGAVETSDIKTGAVTSEKLIANAADAGKVGVVQTDGTIVYQNIDASNVNGKALTSTDLAISVNGATSLLKDVNINIAPGAVTAVKLSADSGTDGRVGVANAAGNVTYTDLNTLVQANQKVETVSAGNGITVKADTTTTAGTTDYNVKLTPGTAGQILTTQTVGSGVETQWKNLEELGISSTPKFFYMPSVVLPTTAEGVSGTNVTFDTTTSTFTVDLHAIYSAQFSNPIKSSNIAASPIGGLSGFVLDRNKYEYHIIYADANVFPHADIVFSTVAGEEGKFTYKVNPNAIVRTGSFMNIVLKVK